MSQKSPLYVVGAFLYPRFVAVSVAAVVGFAAFLGGIVSLNPLHAGGTWWGWLYCCAGPLVVAVIAYALLQRFVFGGGGGRGRGPDEGLAPEPQDPGGLELPEPLADVIDIDAKRDRAWLSTHGIKGW